MTTTLPQPKTVTQEVLHCLIINGKVSIKDFPYLSGFRTRVSELKHKYGLLFTTKKHLGVNKFGHEFIYACHYLPASQIENAINIYNKLQNDKL